MKDSVGLVLLQQLMAEKAAEARNVALRGGVGGQHLHQTVDRAYTKIIRVARTYPYG